VKPGSMWNYTIFKFLMLTDMVFRASVAFIVIVGFNSFNFCPRIYLSFSELSFTGKKKKKEEGRSGERANEK
jgi:hypothetical protein